MTKPFTHIGKVTDARKGKIKKVLLRETTHCWVTASGKRFLKSNGHPPGLVITNKDLVSIKLDVDSIRPIQ